MKIKTTEVLGPIITHPNGDISISGEITQEINLKEFSDSEIKKAFFLLKSKVEILDEKIDENLIHPQTGCNLRNEFKKVKMEYECRFPVWKM